MADGNNTPNLPTGPLMVPASMLQRETSWIVRHERILIVVFVLIAGFFGLQHYLNNSADENKLKASIAEAALVSQKTLDLQLAAQTAQVTEQYQAMIKALAAQNVTLSAANVARQEALGKQQQVNSQLPLSALSVRLQALGNAPPGSVSNTETEVVMTQPATLAVVNTLEQVPVLSANLTNETVIAQNNAAQAAKADSVISTQTTQIMGLNTEIQKQDVACKTEIASVKAAARKSKWNWFKAGSIVTAAVGIVVKVLIF